VVVIRIGVKSAMVDRLLSRFKVRSAVFITAWNPFSTQRKKLANQRAQRQLNFELRRRKIFFLDGEGRGDDEDWPPERSVLAFGVSRNAAASLGRRFRQNAVVFVRYGKVPELLMLK
jgi:hypothetical protein